MTVEYVSVEQGSDAWLELRYDYLTASEVPIALDVSPYETPLQLAERKIARSERTFNESTQRIFAHGHEAERIGREHLSADFNFIPCVVISADYPHFLASLDGIDQERNVIFESKLVGREKLEAIKKGELPEDHMLQVQTQLMVSDAKYCVYFACTKDGDAAQLDVHPDEAAFKLIEEMGNKFMTGVEMGKAPEPGPRDFFEADDPSFDNLRRLKENADQAKQAYEIERVGMIDDYKDKPRVSCRGVKIVQYVKKGSVDYKALVADLDIDVEPYRNPSKTETRVTFDKEKT